MKFVTGNEIMTGKTAGDCYCLLNKILNFKAYYSGYLIKYVDYLIYNKKYPNFVENS